MADGVRSVCWRWQELIEDERGGRLRRSCECGGEGCPLDPRREGFERVHLGRWPAAVVGEVVERCPVALVANVSRGGDPCMGPGSRFCDPAVCRG